MKRIEDRRSRIEDRRRRVLRSSILYSLSSILVLLIGCTHNSGNPEPSTLRQKQDQAVRDPINYKPDNENTQPYDISGGGVNNLDKGALKKDLHDVFDP